MKYYDIPIGYTTQGVVVDIKPNARLLQVRVLELDGLDSSSGLANSTIHPNLAGTPTTQLKWMSTTTDNLSENMDQIYHKGDIVGITYPTGNVGTGLVTGVLIAYNNLGTGSKDIIDDLIGSDPGDFATSRQNSASAHGGVYTGSATSGGSATLPVSTLNLRTQFKNYIGLPVQGLNGVVYSNSDFGWRWNGSDFHLGVDFRVYSGASDPVMAAADGQVVLTGLNGSYGNQVIIAHDIKGEVYHTRYAHLATDSIRVRVGDSVKGNISKNSEATVIANADNTGNSSGSHLHFEIRKVGYVATAPTSSSGQYPPSYINDYYGGVLDPYIFLDFVKAGG